MSSSKENLLEADELAAGDLLIRNHSSEDQIADADEHAAAPEETVERTNNDDTISEKGDSNIESYIADTLEEPIKQSNSTDTLVEQEDENGITSDIATTPLDIDGEFESWSADLVNMKLNELEEILEGRKNDGRASALDNHPEGLQQLWIQDPEWIEYFAAETETTVEELLKMELLKRTFIHKHLVAPRHLSEVPVEKMVKYHRFIAKYMIDRVRLNNNVQEWEGKSREQLVEEHDIDTKEAIERQKHGYPQLWPPIARGSFAPEDHAVGELTVTKVEDLQLLDVNEDHRIHVRTITPALAQGSSIKVIVEDMNAGDLVDQLIMHNLLPPEALIEPGFLDQLMPVGSQMMIKRPYLYLYEGRSTTIMTAHPTDVVINDEGSGKLFNYARDLVHKQDKGSTRSCFDKAAEIDGKYNFVEMFKIAAAMKFPRLDHERYIKATEVRMCDQQSKGRGLYATKDFTAGDLVLCEKALSIRYRDELPNQVDSLWTSFDQGAAAWIIPSVTHNVLNDGKLASEFLAFDTRSAPTAEVKFDATGRPLIDTFAVRRIMKKECEVAMTKYHVLLDPERHLYEQDAEDSRVANNGFWMKLSYINHSCLRNVDKSFIGDMAIVTAARDIKRGEELLLNYCATDADVEDRNAVLKRSYGFSCVCNLCLEQRQEPQELIDRRCDFVNKLIDLLKEFNPDRVTRFTKESKDILFQTGKKHIEELKRSFGAARTIKPEYSQCIKLWLTLLQKVERRPTSDELAEALIIISGADLQDFRKFEAVWDDKTTNLALLSLLSTTLRDEGKHRAGRRVKKLFKTTFGRLMGLEEDYPLTKWDRLMKTAESVWFD